MMNPKSAMLSIAQVVVGQLLSTYKFRGKCAAHGDGVANCGENVDDESQVRAHKLLACEWLQSHCRDVFVW